MNWVVSFAINGTTVSVDIPSLILSVSMSILFLIGRRILYSEFNIIREYADNKILALIPKITNFILILMIILFSVSFD